MGEGLVIPPYEKVLHLVSENDLCFSSAVDLAQRLRTGEVSAVELMSAHLGRIEKHNPAINAVVTLVDEDSLLAAAHAADQARTRGEALGPLHGLPIVHKDLQPTAGVRTTFGSLVYKDFIPDQDSLLVERVRAAGAIMVGKSNTPEFGAGSQTFNEVFGATRNPYDFKRTCGGSSGGAASALAAGLVPIADGSDMGGSLRNPAAFCNVVGLRPTPGLVPAWPSEFPWTPLPVDGPMGRTVEDAALLFSVIAGADSRSPSNTPSPASFHIEDLHRDFAGVRLAFSPDYSGQLPVDPAVAAVVERTAPVFEDLGCVIDPAIPNFAGADQAFKVLRAYLYAGLCGPLLKEHRAQLKDTVVWNTETGLALTAEEILQAERLQTRMFHRMRRFLTEFEFLILPVTQVMPFDVEQPYITEINGEPMETYLDWMRSCYYVTVSGHPAISIPAGFSPEGLPVGLQIVGRHGVDLHVLRLAYAFQQSTEYWKQRPLV